MNTLRTLSLLGATLTTGLVTGAFVLYAHTIMPALKTTDDRTFVVSFQALDRAIINPWFMAGGFMGALVLTLAALCTHFGRAPLPYIALALGLYLIAVVITLAVNVPLNDAIKAAGGHDYATIRADFHETRWAVFNVVRAVVSTGAFVALMGALAKSPG